MKKKVIYKGLLGFPLGIAIGHVISIVVSLISLEGGYVCCSAEFLEIMGNEISAVILQTALSGLLGTVFASCSIIWELDHWSLAKQTGIYFLITFVGTMPIAYITHWMDHSVGGILSYIAMFVIIFFIIWGIQYLIWKRSIKKINARLL